MKLILLLTIVASMLLSAVSQILLNTGMVSKAVRRAIAEGDPDVSEFRVRLSPSSETITLPR
jgi:hypothetical protein